MASSARWTPFAAATAFIAFGAGAGADDECGVCTAGVGDGGAGVEWGGYGWESDGADEDVVFAAERGCDGGTEGRVGC